MWKKSQTYFIGASTLLTISMFFCPLATILAPEGEELKIMYYEKLPYIVMLIMLMTAGICAFLCHKFPLLQARVCMLSALMLTGFQIWLGVDFFRFHNDMVFSPTIVFPLICTILNAMSARKALIDGMTLQAVKSLKKNSRK
ncbi:MAG: DUF4293 family protein [Bacteroidales bacterium]|nr:DUF4293 family protein [Bacteroidales bacterium]